jgi:hypothetical protein
MNWWSGRWITLEAKVDPDLTVISIDVGPNPSVNGMTNSSASINDRSNMIELFRHPTAPHMLNPFYFIANTCARNSERQKAGMYAHFTRATQKLDGDGNRLWIQANGSEGTTRTTTPAREWANYRYWIDWIEILQRNSVVYPATAPAPFKQRPTLSQSGSVITCDPRTAIPSAGSGGRPTRALPKTRASRSSASSSQPDTKASPKHGPMA